VVGTRVRKCCPIDPTARTVVHVSKPPSPSLQVRLLGALEVRVGDELRPMGGPRQRALIGLLALSAGSLKSVSELVDTLWDDEPPAQAVNTIQVYLSRFRRTLASDGWSPLRSLSGGYVLDIPPEAVDALRFGQLADLGHARLAAGDPGKARALLQEGLALWRGPALPDLAGLSRASGLINRLDEQRLSAELDLIDADAALGIDHHVPDLERLARSHPLNEDLVARLMLALFAHGRQADALASYQDLADRLSDELGVDPGPHVREVQLQILRHEAPTAAALRVDAVAVAPPPPRPPPDGPPPLRALPRRRLPLVGREADLVLVRARLADPKVRVVTLIGLGGMGKTTLAMEIAQGASPGDEVVLVPLAGSQDPASALPAICRAAGAVPAWASEPVVEVAARALEGRPVLLVLDNLEQLLDQPESDDVLADLEELLDRLPEVTMLCTSRIPVELSGEYLVPLGPLPVPPATVAGREAVLSYAAVQLFRDRAQAAMPGFEVTDENAVDVATVCRMLDGLPLALELAAARVRILPPSEMARRGDDRLKLLGGGHRQRDRQRSVRDALDWSVGLLDDGERAVFTRLSVFAAGWTVEAAERVCASVDLDGRAVLDILGHLADKSLVVADGSGRTWMLELVQEYAAELLAAAGGARDAAEQAHSDYYLELAERLVPQYHLDLAAATGSLLGAEVGNFEAALGRLQAAGDSARLARMVVVLLDYWFYSGSLVDADRWLAAADRDDVPARARAQLHQAAGNVAFVSADLVRARSSFEVALTVAIDLGEDQLLAWINFLIAIVDRYQGDLDGVLGHLDVAREYACRAGAAQVVTIIDNERGEILVNLGRPAEGRPLIENMRDRARADGSLSHLATTTAHLALAAYTDGDPALATELIRQALEAAEQTGVTPALADVLSIAGALELRLGDPAAAVGILRRALMVNHQVRLLLSLPDLASLLGAALARTGDPVAGARLLAAGRAWRQARGLVSGYTLITAVIDEAEADVAGRLTPEALHAATAAGQAVPFGSVQALEDLTEATVVDIREASQRHTAKRSR
jgi:predicted ATPase/DNA-binding SARP family transcriptional activator